MLSLAIHALATIDDRVPAKKFGLAMKNSLPAFLISFFFTMISIASNINEQPEEIKRNIMSFLLLHEQEALGSVDTNFQKLWQDSFKKPIVDLHVSWEEVKELCSRKSDAVIRALIIDGIHVEEGDQFFSTSKNSRRG